MVQLIKKYQAFFMEPKVYYRIHKSRQLNLIILGTVNFGSSLSHWIHAWS